MQRQYSDTAGRIEEVHFATKPELARHMLDQLLANHGRAAMPWFTADEAHGDNPGYGAGSTSSSSLRHGRVLRCPVCYPHRTAPGR